MKKTLLILKNELITAHPQILPDHFGFIAPYQFYHFAGDYQVCRNLGRTQAMLENLFVPRRCLC